MSVGVIQFSFIFSYGHERRCYWTGSGECGDDRSEPAAGGPEVVFDGGDSFSAGSAHRVLADVLFAAAVRARSAAGDLLGARARVGDVGVIFQ